MADINDTATLNHTESGIRPTHSYESFSNSLCVDVFTTQSELVATRTLLAGAIDVDAGVGIHIDALLLDIDSKLNGLVGRLNESIRTYK